MVKCQEAFAFILDACALSQHFDKFSGKKLNSINEDSSTVPVILTYRL